MRRTKYFKMEEAGAEGAAAGGGDNGGVLDGGANGSGGAIVEFGAEGYKYADKYDTPQDLEKGYSESVKMHTTKMQEMGEKLKGFVGSPEGDYTALEGFDGYSKDVMDSIQEWGKDNGLSQDAYTSLLTKVSAAEQVNIEANKAEQMKLLGANAESRIANTNDKWSARFGVESLTMMNNMAQTAQSVEFFESVLSAMESSSVNPDGGGLYGTVAITQSQLSEAMFVKDSAGMLKMQTDPAYAKTVNEMTVKFNSQGKK